MGNSSRSHHLLKHSLPEVDVLHHFGSIEPKEVSKEINKLGQRDLQAKFRAVYGTQTYSNNNCWLRRKLMEAAGLQTPKASSRGRPAVKQGRAPSPGSMSQSEGPSMSRSGSMASQQVSDRLSAPECNVIRRTKRLHKPKQYEDMLISAQLPGHQGASDVEDCHPAKIHASDSEMSYRNDIVQGQGHGSELVWSKSTTHSFTASHLIAPTTPWTGTLAPSTPEKLAFCGPIPPLLATRQGSTASKLLGSQEVLGEYHSNLPAWADLPSNDRASSQDLDEVSFQVPDMQEPGSDMSPGFVPSPADVAAAYEVLIAPPTPERLMTAARPSAAHLLCEMPTMPSILSSLLTKPSGPQKVPGVMFDYFSSPPPLVTSPDMLPTAPPEFERRMEFPMVSSNDLSDSAGSDSSELDVLLENISSSTEMTQDFDAWLKTMPCPGLEPCKL